MTRRRLLYGLVLLGALALAFAIPRGNRVPRPRIRVAIIDPYASAELVDYARYRTDLASGNLYILRTISQSGQSYLSYRVALTLARDPRLPIAERLEHYRRVLELRIDDPLARSEKRSLYLEIARTAEAGGFIQQALDAYQQALPEEAAVEGSKRLEGNPYRLSNALYKARLYREALEALDGRSAPSIEAPAYRALGEYQEALDAYQRWLDEQPDNLDARFGEAWSYFYLEELGEAEQLFRQLPGSRALYGRALIANRQGDIDRAVALLEQSGSADNLWLASGLYEAKDRYREAIPLYLKLAAGNSSYADDAAYRAYTLAKRLGDERLADSAREMIPKQSFFSLKVGGAIEAPQASTLPYQQPAVLRLARALARANDFEAAIGELSFALRDTQDEATAIAIAELLQNYGEFRQSQRAAQRFIAAGSRDLRTWRVAYPQAYSSVVLRETERSGVEPELVWAVMRKESSFFPQAVSRSNAKGLMQVIPSTWKWLAELQGEAPGDPFDPADNIRYGTFYLGWLGNFFSGDAELMIASYNRGQGYIKRLYEGSIVQEDKDELYREIDTLETREYLQAVALNYRIYKVLYQ